METQLVALASQIAATQAHLQWQLWLALAVLGLIALYVRKFMSAYASKIGEIKAQTDNLEDIKTYLRETTELTEQIKADIGHEDWRERERLTLYRSRMEDLLSAVYAVQAECSRQHSEALGESELRSDETPNNRALVLVALYFPNLRLDTLALQRAALTFYGDARSLNFENRMHKLRRAALKTVANADPVQWAELEQAFAPVFAERSAAMNKSYREFLEASTQIEDSIRNTIPQYVP
jgi:hypothetical protein